MRTRNLALIGTLLVVLATIGCSKKSEEPAKESEMTPAPSAQQMAPATAPMQGMESEDSHNADKDSHPMNGMDSDHKDTQQEHESSGME